jgi:hypothetical protein
VATETTMTADRIYVLQIVMVMENQWFADWGKPPVRVERSYYLDAFMFRAADDEAAYAEALTWLERPGPLTDSNNDLGDGGHTEYFPIGIHQLEEVALPADLVKLANGSGENIGLPGIEIDAIGKGGVPIVREKEQLAVFDPHIWRPSMRAT